MDALPIAEQSGLEFASTNGAAHACGHDLHVAGLVGAARILAAHRHELAGDVLFMFQPGEEGHAGARAMLDEGLLEVAGRRPDAAYALHVRSAELPGGTFSTRPGALLAASDELRVRVVGAGGHGSAPQFTKDPVPVVCEIVTALQMAVTRSFDVFDPVVLSVGVIRAGVQRNIIPDDAFLEATVRGFSHSAQEKAEVVFPRVVRHVAAAHGLSAEVHYGNVYRPTINDADEYELMKSVALEVFGHDRFMVQANPYTQAEDFSEVLSEVPGAYIFLGTCPTEDFHDAPFNHSTTAVFDDRWLADGAVFLAELAVRRMEQQISPALRA
jgi:hippurate hydrolase